MTETLLALGPVLAQLSGPESSWTGWMWFAIPAAVVLVAFMLWTVAWRQHRRGV